MPAHHEQKDLPYPAPFLFDLVADVASYPEFVPWCVGAKILRCGDSWFIADLGIGYKMIKERFTSKVLLTPHQAVDVEYYDGPFKSLSNRWRFHPIDEQNCRVEFELEFAFKSRLLHALVEGLFLEVVRHMVGAFEKRAAEKSAQQLVQIPCPTVKQSTYNDETWAKSIR